MATICHRKLYQQRLKKAFDKKVRPRLFEEGDLVLKKILPSTKIPAENGPQTMNGYMS